MRENRESFYDLFLCSRRSRCSRFIEFKRSVRSISDGKITAKRAKIANKKGSVRCNPGDRALVSGTKVRGFESRQARISPLWNFEESPLSFPSYHPRLYKICESSYGLLLLVRTLRVVRGSWNSKRVSVVIFTAKRTNKEGSVSRKT